MKTYKLQKQNADGSWSDFLVNNWGDMAAAEKVAERLSQKEHLVLRVAEASPEHRERAENIDVYTATEVDKAWARDRGQLTGGGRERPVHPWGSEITNAAR